MIKKVIQNDIFSTNAKHIVFAINCEGLNDDGFAGMIAREYWHELEFCGFNEIELSYLKSQEIQLFMHLLLTRYIKIGEKIKT